MRQSVPAVSAPTSAARAVRGVLPVHQNAFQARSVVRTQALTPESADVVQAALSLQLPSQVSSLLQSGPEGAAAALSGLEPHFGSRAIAGAVQQLTAAAPRLPSLPSLPALDAAGSAVGGALQPLTTSLPSVSISISAPSISLPSLPALPSLPSLPAVAAGADGSSLTSAGAALGQNLSVALAGAAGPGGAELARSAAAAAAAAAGAAPGEPLPPHFGSVAFARSVQSLASWVGERFAGLEVIDAATSASLTSALDQLREVAGLMTLPLPPSLAAVDVVGMGAGGAAAGVGTSLQQLGASAAALGAGLRGVAAAGGEAAVAAPPELLASLTAAFAQAEANGVGGYSLGQVCVVTALSLLAIAASTPPEGYTGPAASSYSDRDDNDDELSHDYDPDVVAAYFARRPLAVARRSAQVAAEAAAFGAALLADLATGRLEANEQARAEQLRGVIERLGPAYVKVAQALSTRVDLLTPAYFNQIQLLQDRVPPFPCEEAKAEMARAFGGRTPDQVFASLSEKPVAAASLGQVYKATLRPELGGGCVAVKVQRPHVLEQVALDLLLMRRAAVVMKEAAQMNTDWAAVIDAWAVRFFHELDYRREANNAATFAAQMAAAGVSGVTVAPVRRDLSSDCVLVTEWVEGEKLSESGAADVRELCNTLLNAYLIQLLDTGFLHADPHPGNLIRTPDGRICVLDFGLMTEVTPEQRIALVEYIAHLSTQDWAKLALDLQTLGFIPPEVDTQEAGLVEPLGRVMVQLVGGGGASKVNIDKVMSDLEALGESYPITIPPFFALILRAFSVIEGIALRVDPDYAIVGECFPYLARRLLNDDSPRMRAVLRDVLYGGRQRLDVERLMRVADGLSSFTTDGLAAGGAAAAPAASAAGRSSLARAMAAATAGPGVAASSGAAASSSTALARSGAPAGVVEVVAVSEQQEGAVLSPVMVDTLRSVLRPGSYVSELLVDELVAAVDALSRDSLSALVRTLLASGPAAASLRSVEALGPLRSVLLPLPTPVEVLARMAPAVAVTPEDQEALGVVRAILTLSQRMAAADRAAAAATAGSAGGAAGLLPSSAAAAALARGVQPRRAARLASELSALLPELTPGLAYTSDLFVRALVRRVTVRIGEAATLAVSGRPAAGSGLVGGGMMGGVGVPAAQQPAGAIAMRNMMAPGAASPQQQQPAQAQQRPGPGPVTVRPGQRGPGAQGGRR